MEGLRPEQDEVARFQETKKGAKSSGAGLGGGKSKPPAPKKSAEKSGGGKSIGGVLLLLAIVTGVALWTVHQQDQRIKALESQLSEASGFINQSKLLMARFEGQLNETDASMTESDTEAAKKLKFLDSEMRKLWGIAYDRNRKSIAANGEKVTQLSATLEKNRVGVDKQISQMSNQVAELKTAIENLQGSLKAAQAAALRQSAGIETAQSLLQEQSDLQEQRLVQLGNELGQLSGKLETLAGKEELIQKTAQLEQALKSIDAFRKSMTGRVIALENALKQPPAPAQP